MEEGKVKAYSRAVKSGVAEDKDGHAYFFSKAQWPESSDPIKNQKVRVTIESERLIKIRPEE